MLEYDYIPKGDVLWRVFFRSAEGVTQVRMHLSISQAKGQGMQRYIVDLFNSYCAYVLLFRGLMRISSFFVWLEDIKTKKGI